MLACDQQCSQKPSWTGYCGIFLAGLVFLVFLESLGGGHDRTESRRAESAKEGPTAPIMAGDGDMGLFNKELHKACLGRGTRTHHAMIGTGAEYQVLRCRFCEQPLSRNPAPSKTPASALKIPMANHWGAGTGLDRAFLGLLGATWGWGIPLFACPALRGQ